MQRALRTILIFCSIQLHAAQSQSINSRDAVYNYETRNTLRILDLRYKYQTLLNRWTGIKQAAFLGKIISTGMAVTYSPLYCYRANDILSEYRRPLLEKITTALYFTAFAGMVSYLAYAAHMIAENRQDLEKKVIIPKLMALKLMLAEEFKDENSDEAKSLLSDIENLLALLA